jgi:hypothetical protein
MKTLAVRDMISPRIREMMCEMAWRSRERGGWRAAAAAAAKRDRETGRAGEE